MTKHHTMNRITPSRRRGIRWSWLGVLLAVYGLILADARSEDQHAAAATDAASKVLAVDSSAFVFSPGNWVGDAGRGGKLYRQTWNTGAYVRITWTTEKANVSPFLLLDTSMYPADAGRPVLAANLDGVWTSNLPCDKQVSIPGLSGPGEHVLTVYLKKSVQDNRWGMPGTSATNVLRITGLKVDADSQPGREPAYAPWVLIVGDSITEGIGAQELEGYSYLVGQGMRTQGFEYCISACGWSGWIHRGDKPPGDVPGYYTITDSADGTGGKYHDADSRWNKIDANHSLLDSRGRLSAYGQVDQEPSMILINYGTNDAIHHKNPSDVKASMTQGLAALRQAAPEAHLFVLIPFGQYMAGELKQTVNDYPAAHPDDQRVTVIDLGVGAARALRDNGYWGGLHPNPRAHAVFASQITAQMVARLCQAGAIKP